VKFYKLIRHSPNAIHQTLFTKRYSPNAICQTPFTKRHSTNAIHQTPFPKRYSPNAIHQTPFVKHLTTKKASHLAREKNPFTNKSLLLKSTPLEATRQSVFYLMSIFLLTRNSEPLFLLAKFSSQQKFDMKAFDFNDRPEDFPFLFYFLYSFSLN